MNRTTNGQTALDATREMLHAKASAARDRAIALATRALLAQEEAAQAVQTIHTQITSARHLRDEMRSAVASHARTMCELGYTCMQTVVIAEELADTATRQIVIETGSGVWPRGTALRSEFAEWTVEAYRQSA